MATKAGDARMVDPFPEGGQSGDVLAKTTNDNEASSDNTKWLPKGLPDGGTTGQILSKAGDGDFEAEWVTLAAGMPEAPENGVLYGRQNAGWTPAVRVSGDTMTGLLRVVPSNIPTTDEDGLVVESVLSRSKLAFQIGVRGSTLVMDGITGSNRWIQMKYDGADRWAWWGDNGGLNLRLLAYNPDREVMIFDRFSGLATVAGDPTEPLGIATRQYVDAAAANAGIPEAPENGQVYGRANNAWERAVAASGDTMTGALALPATDPVDANDATRKAYVDAGDEALQDQLNLVLGGLLYVGAYDVVANRATFTPPTGIASGPLPPANAPGVNRGYFLVCTTAGTGTGNAPPVPLQVGDQLISGGPGQGAAWNVLAVGGGQASVTASQVAVTPPAFGGNNVQTSLMNAEVQVAEIANRRLQTWRAGASYTVDQEVIYDNRAFRVLVAINNAPATPDFSTITPIGYGQTDYWWGNADITNWAAGNWVLIATLPAYGAYRVEISDLHASNDTALMFDIVTGYNTATAVVAGQTHQGTGSWSELRLSATGNGAAVRLELKIAVRNGTPNFKIFITGETRGTNVNQTTIPKPLTAIPDGANMGGTTRALIENLLFASFTTSGDIATSYGKSIRFSHANRSDQNDGKIGARLFNRGLNIVGVATETGDTKRYVGLWGDVRLETAGSQMTAPTFLCNRDNYGYETFGGGWFYKKSGTGMVIRQSSGNQQPKIENNDGSNARDIIDTVNGDARYVLKSQAAGHANPLLITNLWAGGAGGSGPWLDTDVWVSLWSGNYSIPRGGNSVVLVTVTFSIYGSSANTDFYLEWAVTNSGNDIPMCLRRQSNSSSYDMGGVIQLVAPVSGTNPSIGISVRKRQPGSPSIRLVNASSGAPQRKTQVLLTDMGLRQ